MTAITLVAFGLIGTGTLLFVRAATQTNTFIPVEDAYVTDKTPSKVFDTTVLKANDKAGPCTSAKNQCVATESNRSYLKYTIGSIPAGGTVNSVKMKFYVSDASVSGGSIYAVPANTWNETTLTWNNKPAYTNTPGNHRKRSQEHLGHRNPASRCHFRQWDIQLCFSER